LQHEEAKKINSNSNIDLPEILEGTITVASFLRKIISSLFHQD
jgi:hypothetical protein